MLHTLCHWQLACQCKEIALTVQNLSSKIFHADENRNQMHIYCQVTCDPDQNDVTAGAWNAGDGYGKH
jgi:hypothetical protein